MTPQQQHAPTILIVDDEPANIRVLDTILSGDYRVLAATNGLSAINVALDQQPDLILLDVMMPGMDGYEVCSRLKNDPATGDIPVIFVTALNEEEDEVKGLELGAVDYLTKPVRPALVRLRVRIHLELLRYRDHLAHLLTQHLRS